MVEVINVKRIEKKNYKTLDYTIIKVVSVNHNDLKKLFWKNIRINANTMKDLSSEYTREKRFYLKWKSKLLHSNTQTVSETFALLACDRCSSSFSTLV